MAGQRTLALGITKYEEVWHATFLHQRLTIWRQTELSRSVARLERNRASDMFHIIVTAGAVPFEHTKQRTALRDYDFSGRVMRKLLRMLKPVKLLAHHCFSSHPNSVEPTICRQRSPTTQ